MDLLQYFPGNGIPCPSCQLLCKHSSCHKTETEDFIQYSCARCRTELCRIKTFLRVPVAIGSSDFEEIRKSKAPYVDKTLLIKEICEDPVQAFAIIRPQVYGRSLNLSMISDFFSILELNPLKRIFEGTKIFEEKDIIMEHARQHMVIRLNFGAFTSAYCSSERNILEFLQEILLEVKRNYYDDLKDLNDFDKKFFEEFDDTKDVAIILQGLRTFSEIFHRVSGQKCIILIDDFDTPIKRTIDSKKEFEILKAFYFPFLRNGVIDNPYLFKGIIISCTKTCGLVDIPNYSFLEENFQMGFGFTEEEVKNLIQKWRKISDHKIDETMRNLKDCYGGYEVLYKGQILGLYNPTSIMRYLEMGKVETYWEPTSETCFLRDLHKNFPNKALEMAEVFHQDVFEQKIEKDLSRVELHENTEKVWTLLFFAGYVTQVFDGIAPQKEGFLRLKVSNKEKWRAFQKISKRLELLMQKDFQENMKRAFEKFDVQSFFNGVNNWIRTPKPDDPDLAYRDEIAYRDTVRGLFKSVCGEEWDIIEEEEEEVMKRSELIVVPKRFTGMKKAYIFEFEFLAKGKNNDKNLQEKRREAYKKILEKECWKAIPEDEYDVEEILGVGVVGCDLWLSYYSNWIREFSKIKFRKNSFCESF